MKLFSLVIALTIYAAGAAAQSGGVSYKLEPLSKWQANIVVVGRYKPQACGLYFSSAGPEETRRVFFGFTREPNGSVVVMIVGRNSLTTVVDSKATEVTATLNPKAFPGQTTMSWTIKGPRVLVEKAFPCIPKPK